MGLGTTHRRVVLHDPTLLAERRMVDVVESLWDASSYIAVMLAGAALGRRGLRLPGWLFTIVVAMLVGIVAMSIARGLIGEALYVILVSVIHALVSMGGSALASLPLRLDTGGCDRHGGRHALAASVVIALIAGVALGSAGLEAPEGLIRPLLLLLVFLAGLEIGEARLPAKPSVRLLALPLASLAGSIAASLPFYALMGVSPAVAAGMGWYTFTSPYLKTASGDPRLAAIALISNMVREQATILIVTLLGCRLPLQVAVALGGVTTMDTTLPIYARIYGARGALTAITNGAILTLLVPLAVPLLYTLLH